MDAKALLEQFLGGANPAAGRPGTPGQGFKLPGGGNFASGAMAGSLLGLVLGKKKVGKMAGGLLSYGGAAAVATLAYKAYQNWQQGQQVQTAPVARPEDLQHVDRKFIPQAEEGGGENFPLSLIYTMIAAAKADGHLDAGEQQAIFDHVEKLALDAESKGFVFDALSKPVDLSRIASGAQGPEQASELYMAARLIADGDHPGERAFLEALAHRLQLPAELVAHLDHQVI